MCRYRTHDGKKCAIGMLIPDDKYGPEMESQRLTDVCEDIGFSEYATFLVQLQKVHDNCETDYFLPQLELGMAIFAELWGLNYVVPESVSP